MYVYIHRFSSVCVVDLKYKLVHIYEPICTYMCTYTSMPLHGQIKFMCLFPKWLFFSFMKLCLVQ